MNLRLPNITGATVGERLEQVVRYLFSLVNDLNFALGQREQEKLQQTAGSERTEENNRLRPKSVTTDILADGAVTNDKIADGAIDKSKLSFSTDLIAGSGIAVDGRKISTVAPRNLLDNSDFRNPVNQRGQGSYSGSGYGIDRWRLWDDYATITVNAASITISGNTAWQYLKETPPEVGKTYTAAVKKADGTISLCSGIMPSSGVCASNECMQIGVDGNNGSIYFGLKIGSYVWAALYIGEFTTETLPEYQPKGWAVELAECQRYYRYYQYVTCAVPGNPWAWFALNYPPMRAVPILTTGALYAGGSTQISGAKITSARVSETGVSVVYITGASENTYYAENVELSAE